MRQEQAVFSDSVFSDYLQLLAGNTTPDGSSFERLWTALRRAVAKGLRKRGMWELSPRLFGVVGDAYWVEKRGVAGAGGALDELTADVYTFIFVDRLESLLAQLEVKPQVEGLIHLNIDHFLLERQRRCDPLGTRLYKVLHAAIRDLIASGQLRMLGDSGRLRNLSVLCLDDGQPDQPVADQPVGADQVTEAVAGWIDALLPELVITTGRGYAPLLARVGERITGLEAHGIGAFRFRDLIEPLRADLRSRWAALPTGGADAATDDTLLPIAAEPTPQENYETRRRFNDLTECVARRIRALDREDADRGRLEALWNVLVDGALEGSDQPGSAGLLGAAIPSQRQLARDLAISRDRLSTLYEMVKHFVRACQDEEQPPVSEGSTMPQKPEDGPTASFESLQQQLRQRSSDRAARILAAKQQAAPAPDEAAPRPGDIYALAEGPDCEWAILGPAPDEPVPNDRSPNERPPDERSQILAAPADTLPAIGPGDLAIAAHAPAGPLSIRCRLACTLPQTLFATAMPSRTLDKASLDRVRALAGTPREALPTDLPDPELEDWLARLEIAIEPLREPSGRPVPNDRSPKPSRGPKTVPIRRPDRPGWRSPAWLALAAAGAGVALGIGFARLATTDRPQQPSLEPAVQTLRLGDTPRGEDHVQFPVDASAIRIALLLPTALPCDTLALTLLDGNGRVCWHDDDVPVPDTLELYLRLPRGFLAGGIATLRLESVCGEERSLLSERPFGIIAE